MFYKPVSGANWKKTSIEQSDNDPVVLVSWYDAVSYCNWRSEAEGLQAVYTVSGTTVSADWRANGYRLPTEAEWEYAARGGSVSEDSMSYTGASEPGPVAWYIGNSSGKTHPVGLKEPNSLDLYDMCGNVREWCWDWFSEKYKSASVNDPTGEPSGEIRVVRGGSWMNDFGLRSSDRGALRPGEGANDAGFRIARRP
jgi:formylglycine-generating enzyme required for sulfatase activity